MSFFGQERKVEMTATSGVLRIAIDPRPSWGLLCAEAFLIVIFDRAMLRLWAGLSFVYRGLFLWGTVGAVLAWFYQLTGSEVIEFDSQQVSITTTTLGWERNREYAIADCSQLEVRTPTKGDSRALQFKAGWRSVSFGKYLSEDEASQALTLLQKELPETARQLLVDPRTSKSHFQTLGLG